MKAKSVDLTSHYSKVITTSHQMTLAEDLGVLNLSPGDQDDPKKIRKAYLGLSRTCHPDKQGGSTEAFQRLSNAYGRLVHSEKDGQEEASSPAAAKASGAADHHEQHAHSYAAYSDQWHRYYWDFFNDYDEAQFDNFDCYEGEFEAWETSREERRKAWSRHHQDELRRGRDFRDKRAETGEPKCMFCGKNTPITKDEAISEGIDWEEYSNATRDDIHKDYPSYNTCWHCKTNHLSVLTESQACKKFAKKLNYHIKSKRTGAPYRPVFWKLKTLGRSFHHQPVTEMYDGPTRNSEYYWYPDLEREALARGWRPRGKLKDEVPWQRKDISRDLVVHTSPAKRQRKGTAPMVTPTPLVIKRRRGDSDEDGGDGDRKPRAKPRKLKY